MRLSRTTVIKTVVPVEHRDRKEYGIEREAMALSSETTSSRQMGKEGSFVSLGLRNHFLSLPSGETSIYSSGL